MIIWKYVFVVAFFYFLGHHPVAAQLNDYKAAFQQYIPKGWVLDTALRSDLNKDQQPDVVLVFRNTSTANLKKNENSGAHHLDLNPRRLLILFKTGAGYSKQLSTDAFLPSVNSDISPCLEDPLYEGGLEISKGLLKIHLHYWLSCGSWYVTDYVYTFRFQNKKFELIGLDVSSFHRALGDITFTSYNFSTRRKQMITGVNDFEKSKAKAVEKWEQLKPAALYDLSKMTGDTVFDDMVN